MPPLGRTTALALALATAAGAQERPSRAAPSPTSEVIQCPSVNSVSAADARAIETAREQLAKAREEAGMPDHAIAALLVSDRPELAALFRTSSRSEKRGPIRADMDVFLSMYESETMVAVVLRVKNPRARETWEPREAWVKTGPPQRERVPAAVRSNPQRIAPGETARIAIVFDKADVGLDAKPVTIELLRGATWEVAFDLAPEDVRPASTPRPPSTRRMWWRE